MEDEELSELCGGDGVVGGDEDGLFGKAVDDDEDCGEASGVRKLFDEVHGNRVPRFFGDRKLLEKSVRLVALGLGSETRRASRAVFFDECSDFRPCEFSSDEFEGLVLAKVSCDRMIVLVLEDSESEIICVRDVDSVIE